MAVLEFWKHRIVNFFFNFYFFYDQQLAFENNEIRF